MEDDTVRCVPCFADAVDGRVPETASTMVHARVDARHDLRCGRCDTNSRGAQANE
jgi:hypothetical protein